MGSTIGIENIRVQASNQIKKIDLQINKINELGNDYEKIQYIGATIPDLKEEEIKLEDDHETIIYEATLNPTETSISL